MEKCLIDHLNYIKILQKKYAFFQKFEKIFTQSEEYKEKFIQLGVEEKKIFSLGNMKLDNSVLEFPQKSLQVLMKKAHLNPKKKIIVWGSTHASEEQLAIDIIKRNFWGDDIQWVIVPRHNQRFDEVINLFKISGLKYNIFSQKRKQDCSILIVDQMNILRQFYAVCTGAIVCGSFFSNGVGGHNIFEPCMFNKPVIYGPYMYSQENFVQLSKIRQLGVQCDKKDLIEVIESYVLNFSDSNYAKRCETFFKEMSGISQKMIKKYFFLI